MNNTTLVNPTFSHLDTVNPSLLFMANSILFGQNARGSGVPASEKPTQYHFNKPPTNKQVETHLTFSLRRKKLFEKLDQDGSSCHTAPYLVPPVKEAT
jgi:hypothetical protein